MGSAEKKLLDDPNNKKKMAEDHKKWIVDRKRQRTHFQQMSLLMRKLHRKGVQVGTEIWDNAIEPNIKE